MKLIAHSPNKKPYPSERDLSIEMTGNGASASIVRGKHVITRTLDRHRVEQIDDGAVLQRGGIIVAVGTFADLRRANPTAPIVGDGEQALLPGFVNAHHHVGLSPLQLGAPDETLEKWFGTCIALRDRIPYYDTLYAAFE